MLVIFTDILENLSEEVNQLMIDKNPKTTQNPDISANKLFTEIPRKSPAADLSVEDKKRFQDKLKLQLKGENLFLFQYIIFSYFFKCLIYIPHKSSSYHSTRIKLLTLFSELSN